MLYKIVSDKGRYLRLVNGHPVPCPAKDMEMFEEEKAHKIVKNLPKTLKKFNYKVVPAFDEVNAEVINENVGKQMRVIEDTHTVGDKATAWLKEVEQINSFTDRATSRREELNKELSHYDRLQQDIIHEIEFNKKKPAPEGYQLYSRLHDIRKERRDVKDELIVLNTILGNDVSCIKAERVEVVIKGLNNRKYTCREEMIEV